MSCCFVVLRIGDIVKTPGFWVKTKKETEGTVWPTLWPTVTLCDKHRLGSVLIKTISISSSVCIRPPGGVAVSWQDNSVGAIVLGQIN